MRINITTPPRVCLHDIAYTKLIYSMFLLCLSAFIQNLTHVKQKQEKYNDTCESFFFAVVFVRRVHSYAQSCVAFIMYILFLNTELCVESIAVQKVPSDDGCAVRISVVFYKSYANWLWINHKLWINHARRERERGRKTSRTLIYKLN